MAGSYTGSLVATDGAGATVVVKTWTFAVLPADVLVPKYGPGGKPCDNSGKAVDGAKHDMKFTCDCAGLLFKGTNCEIKTDKVQDVKWPMVVSDAWNESTLGPAQGYKLRYTLGESYDLRGPNLTRRGLFVNFTDTGNIAYSMVVTADDEQDEPPARSGRASAAGNTPGADDNMAALAMPKRAAREREREAGKFFVDNDSGEALAKLAQDKASLGNYTGRLRATEGHDVVDVKTWSFEILQRDSDDPTNGELKRDASSPSPADQNMQ